MKFRKIVHLFAAVIVTVPALSSMCLCRQNENRPVRQAVRPQKTPVAVHYKGKALLGLNLPLTGPYADQGKDELRAFRLAIEELNRDGGVLGRKIVFMVKDTRSEPAIAVANAAELIDRHQAVMITGGVSSAVAVAVGELCQKKKTLFMATVTHSDETTGRKGHRYMFRKSTSATMDARALSAILSKYYAKNNTYFFITADYTWGLTTEAAIVQAIEPAGARVLGRIRTPLGNRDFAIPLTQVQRARPDVLVLVLFGDDLDFAIKKVTVMGMKRALKLVVVPYIDLNMARKAGPTAINGIIASAPWYWRLSEIYKFSKEFVDAFYEKYHRMPSNCSESAYVNIMEYARAVETTQSFESHRIIRFLEGREFKGLKDGETWRAWDHQCIQTVYLLKGKKPSDMENEYDFFDIIYRVPGADIARSRRENPIALEPLGKR